MSPYWLRLGSENNHVKWPDQQVDWFVMKGTKLSTGCRVVDWFLKKEPKQSTGSVVVDWFLKKEPKQPTG